MGQARAKGGRVAARTRIGLREIRALKTGEEIWDSTVRGFGARRRRTAAVSYVLMYRTDEGRLRRYTIGRHGVPWTPDAARTEALRILGEKVKGTDPAATKRAKRTAKTVADLCDLYWADAESGNLVTRRRTPKKVSTLLSDKGRIEKHIKPLLGAMKVLSVTMADVETFMRDVATGRTAGRAKTGKRRGLSNVRGGRGAASRTVGLLGAIFSYAIRKGMRADNPVRGVARPADGRRERRLTENEYRALGVALQAAEEANVWPPAVKTIRFLAVTGWRTGEALALQRSEVNLSRRTATLADSKTGRSMRPLSYAACDVLSGATMQGKRVFPASRGDSQMSGFRSFWARIAKLGGLPPDVTPHVLRHSFASLASDLGYSEPTIGALIGHRSHTITGRYVHTADAVLLAAADAVARRTVELMGDLQTDIGVVEFPKRAGVAAE
jgi:integrase